MNRKKPFRPRPQPEDSSHLRALLLVLAAAWFGWALPAPLFSNSATPASPVETPGSAAPAAPMAPLETAPRTLLHLDDLSFRYGSWAIEAAGGTVRLERIAPDGPVAVRGTVLASLRLFPASSPFNALFENIRLDGEVRFEPRQGTVQVERMVVAVPEVGTIQMAGRFDPRGPWSVRLFAQELSAAPVLKSWTAPGQGFHFGGSVRLSGRLEGRGSKAWTLHLQAASPNTSFHDADYTRAGENIHWRSEAVIRSENRGSPVQFRGSLKIDKGEALVKEYYVDFEKEPVNATCRLTTQSGRKPVRLEDFRFHWGKLLDFSARGEAVGGKEGRRVRLQVSVPQQSLVPAFKTLIQEPLKHTRPWLQTAELQGRWAAELEWTDSGGTRTAEGRIDLQRVDFRVPEEGFAVGGLQARLPIAWSSGDDTGGRSRPLQDGGIAFQALTTRFFSLPPTEAAFKVGTNRLELARPLAVPLPGGTVALEAFRLQHLFSGNRRGFFLIHADPFDLAPFVAKGLGKALPVVAHVRNWRLEWDGDRIYAESPVTFDLFSGQAVMEDFSVHRPLQPGTVVSLDARWTGIDLEPLTAVTAFGTITGRLKGSVENLRLVGGVPIGFDLVLESQDTPSVPRKISVAAINNLAQVGTAQSPFIGAGGLMTVFFKDFPYQKIGIQCILENDTFTIRGLIREGGVEYLVKRGGFRGVNIINQNPENRISWQDMIGRLERISESGPAQID